MSARILKTPGKWRKVKDGDGRDRRLPGKAGYLTVVRTWGHNAPPIDSYLDGAWIYVFKTDTSMTWGHCNNAVLRDDGRVEIVGINREVDEYAPASSVRKARKLPIPERPQLSRYLDRDHKTCHSTIHKVGEVEKWPDPNREWNEEDALVRPLCHSNNGGWVRPERMQPSIRKRDDCTTLCERCYPNQRKLRDA